MTKSRNGKLARYTVDDGLSPRLFLWIHVLRLDLNRFADVRLVY